MSSDDDKIVAAPPSEPAFAFIRHSALFMRPGRLTDVSAWHRHIPFAFWCIAELRPQMIVELGTHKGDSYCAFCQAVDRLSLSSRCFAIDTWEGDEHSGRYGEEVYQELAAYHGPRYGHLSTLIKSTFDSAVDRFDNGSIDLLHIDGFHTYDAVRHDFETWRPKLTRDALVLFHDTAVHDKDFGVWRLWAEISQKYPSFEFVHGHGLGVLAMGGKAEDLVECLRVNAEEARYVFSRLGEAVANTGQIASLHGRQVERESEINRLRVDAASLRQALTEREGELASLRADAAGLRQALTQREGERDSLKTEAAKLRNTVAAREGELNSLQAATRGLHQAVSAREGELSSLQAEAGALRQSLKEREGELGRLGAELVDVHESASWRLTAAVREIGRFGDRLRRAIWPRLFTFKLQPAAQLASINAAQGIWWAQGTDPHFLLVPTYGHLPTRWCELEIRMNYPDSGGRATLRVDRGGGFAEESALALPRPQNGFLRTVIELPRLTRALRLDPCDRPGRLELKDVVIREISRYRAKRIKARSQADGAACEADCPDETNAHPETEGSTPPLEALASNGAAAADCLDAKTLARDRFKAEFGAFLASGANLTLPQPQVPLISIVLVLYNQAELTYACLCSIVAHATADCEVIIIDNASTDHTAELLEHTHGAVVVRNAENRFFPGGCNQALEHARGKYLLLLNNDAQLFPGSIQAALAVLEENEGVGAVGGRILNLSGRLQEAGQFLWSDGSSVGYGRGDVCDRPEYMFRRDVDYCSAAFLLTRTSLFKELGGFDEIFSPGYYEETDFCVRLWKQRLRVVYEPRAVIVHFEFGSSDPVKAGALMARNRAIICSRHADYLAKREPPDAGSSIRARYAPRPRPHVLFIDDSIPHLDHGSGYPRANAIVNAMARLGAAVTVFPATRSEEPWRRIYRDLRPEIEVMADSSMASLHAFLAARRGCYDAIFVSRPHNLRLLLDVLRDERLRDGCRLVYDAEAVFGLRSLEKARILGDGNLQIVARELEEEFELAAKVDEVVCVSELERRHFVERGTGPVYVLGHSLELKPSANSFEMRRDILFVGETQGVDSPNADSILWFCRQVLPHIRARLAGEDVRLVVVGRNTLSHLSALADDPAVELVGAVEDLSPYYEGARIFVAPTRFAAGISLKVYGAAARGVPVVTTALIATQLGWVDGEELLTAPTTDPERFAAQCVHLYSDQKLWSRLRERAFARVHDDCNPASFAESVKAIITRPLAHDTLKYAEWIRAYDTLTADDKRSVQSRISDFTRNPLISVLVPLYNTPERWLRRCIESVRNQLYPNWELCLVDDASTHPHVAAICGEYAAQDKRIHFVRRDVNGHIAAATNTALDLATGDFVGLLDHDDELAGHALYMVADTLETTPELDLIFTDEDKIDEQGARYDPWFKSDWNYDLMLSQNAVVHFAVYRRSLLQQIGGFREGFEGSQDYDATLRFVEGTSPARIRHLPFVLYHWRAIPGSVALSTDQKDYPYENAARAIQDHLDRVSPGAAVTREPHPGYYRVHWPLPAELPRVTVIIPTRDGVHLLRAAVESILDKTSYGNFEILVINNQSKLPETRDFLNKLAEHPAVRVLDFNQPYSFAALNNWAVRQTESPLLAFVNNDTEVLSPDWLSEMVSHALRTEVGAAGAMLYYPDRTIQHAGIVVGIGGTAGHPHRGLPSGQLGYFGRAAVAQQFSAVTAACMVMRREVFLEVGGFDEADFSISFNDVDIGLRVRRAGYSVVWTPYAELIHHESATLGLPDTPQRREQYKRECANLRTRWPDALTNDPFYNPNLTINGGDFALAFPPRVRRPWTTEAADQRLAGC